MGGGSSKSSESSDSSNNDLRGVVATAVLIGGGVRFCGGDRLGAMWIGGGVGWFRGDRLGAMSVPVMVVPSSLALNCDEASVSCALSYLKLLRLDEFNQKN